MRFNKPKTQNDILKKNHIKIGIKKYFYSDKMYFKEQPDQRYVIIIRELSHSWNELINSRKIYLKLLTKKWFGKSRLGHSQGSLAMTQ